MTPSSRNEGCVLLVDDDPHIRRGYARLLISLGYEVVTAENGPQGIAALLDHECDAILVDINMPGMTGVEFLKAVRRSDLDVPLILMTGAPEIASAIEAIEYGALRYLAKPVNLATLAEAVHTATRLRKLAQLKRAALELLGTEGKQLGDRASLDACFSRALETLWMALQPIVHCGERMTFAYEALVRSDESSLPGAVDLLDAAERLDRVFDLGRCVRACTALAAREAPPATLLFVNLHPADLKDPELYSPNAPLSQLSPRVVLEITEREPLNGIGSLASKMAQLRKLGFRVAIDDLGAGYAGLSTFSQVQPDFVKLDMALVRDVHLCPRKQSIVRAMTKLCTEELAVQVVCEGVESAAERDVLAAEGCSLFQGYLFARPARGFPAPSWS